MKSSKTKETLEEFLSRVEEMNTGIANITENTDKLKLEWIYNAARISDDRLAWRITMLMPKDRCVPMEEEKSSENIAQTKYLGSL